MADWTTGLPRECSPWRNRNDAGTVATPPTGAAGGALGGTYPNPVLAAGLVTTYSGNSSFDVGALLPSTMYNLGVANQQCQTDTKGIVWTATAITVNGKSKVDVEVIGTVNTLSGPGASFKLNFPRIPVAWGAGFAALTTKPAQIYTVYAIALAQDAFPISFIGTCPLAFSYVNASDIITLDGTSAALNPTIQSPPAGVATAGGYTFICKFSYVI